MASPSARIVARPTGSDEKLARTLARAVEAGWCATSFARPEDAEVRHAYWNRCVAERRVEVYACFDDTRGGATVGACSLSASRHGNEEWNALLTAALERYCHGGARVSVWAFGADVHGARPRDVEEIVTSILPIALAFAKHAKKSVGGDDQTGPNGTTSR